METLRLPDCCPRSELTVTVVERAATVTLALGGEIDRDNADHLSHVISAADRPGVDLIVLDVRGVAFLGSSGIAALLAERARAETGGRRLVLRRPRPFVYRVLEISGVLEVFGLPTADTPTHPVISR